MTSKPTIYPLFMDNKISHKSEISQLCPTLCDSMDFTVHGSPGQDTGVDSLYLLQYSWASLLAQLIKNLPAVQETWVRSLGW